MNDRGNGVLRHDAGRFFGILFELKNGWQRIWSNVSLLLGSTIKIRDIRFLAL